MLRRLLTFLRRVYIRAFRNKGGASCMLIRRTDILKRKRSSEPFLGNEHLFDIRRVGKELFIYNRKLKTYERISKHNIENMIANALKSSKSASIQTIGISRAQLGGIARYIQDNIINTKVSAKEIVPATVNGKKYIRHKLILTKGDDDEQEQQSSTCSRNDDLKRIASLLR